ncbi:MAG: hypothetical protein HY289_07390 [Planctomycetes bacterium]|nr:hypothetical protein [Planctomycetota bacterium]
MPTLVVENVPPDVYEQLQRRAADEKRTLQAETLHLLAEALGRPAPRVPDLIPCEEISAPFDIPRSSVPVTVAAYDGKKRWPDPLDEDAPEAAQ